jgi:hypothetical protein
MHSRNSNTGAAAEISSAGNHLVKIWARIAQPTDKLDAVVRFYREALGLPRLLTTAYREYVRIAGISLGLEHGTIAGVAI